MKSSKKLLVALLVFTMLLSTLSVGFAAGFKDVADEDVAAAVERLVALKIINGYPDGTFKPANPITRAEFAKVVVSALGLASAADYAKGASPFVDVAADHWAVGYIKVASDMGIVQGRGNGIFSPEDNVTYAESITMVVRALGYEPKAKYIGGFPGGYLAVASELDLTDGINVVNSLAATRGDVAKILDNALEAPLMVQTGWNPNNPNWEADEDKNLLETKLGVKVIKGTVENFDDEDMVVSFEDGAKESGKDAADEYKVAKGISFANLKGVDVTAWKLGKDIVYFEIDSSVFFDFVTEKTVSNSVYKVDLANKDKTYTVSEAAYTEAVDESLVRASIDGKKLTVYENYGKLTEGGIITAAKANVLEYKKEDTSSKLRNIDDYELVIINGKAASYDDLEEGMYFEYSISEKVIFATDKVVKGKLDRVKEEAGALVEARIAGKYAKLASRYYISASDGDKYALASGLDALDNFFGEDVFALLNVMGKVVYIAGDVEEATTSFFGFAVRQDPFNDKLRVTQVIDGKAKDVTYVVDTDDLDIDKIKVIASGDTDSTIAEAVYKFSINSDNEIVKAENKATSKGSISKFEKNGDYIETASGRYYADDAVIFHVYSEEIKALNWKDIKGTTDVSGLTLYADGAKAKVMVIVGDKSFASSDELKVALLLDSNRISKDKKEFKIITGEGEDTFIAKDNSTAQYEYVVYTEDDEGQKVSSYAYGSLTGKAGNWTIVGGSAEKASSNFVTVGTVTYRVANDVVVYEIDAEDDEFVQLDTSDILDGDTVECVLYKGVIKYIHITVKAPQV